MPIVAFPVLTGASYEGVIRVDRQGRLGTFDWVLAAAIGAVAVAALTVVVLTAIRP